MSTIFDWSGKESTRRKTIPKRIRELVWKKYMKDKTEGKCYCCRITTITFMNFEVGHNRAKSKGGGDSISNLRPICRGCNSSMGTQSMDTFKVKYFSKPKGSVKKKPARKRTKRTSSSIFG